MPGRKSLNMLAADGTPIDQSFSVGGGKDCDKKKNT